MAQEGFKRKLTAILSADAVGYSRLMGEDEEATVRTLTAYREVLTSLTHQYNGRVVDASGDNLLAEFASVVDAVQCAVAAQKEIKKRNEPLNENRRMQFRIGINLGDVIQEEERIYGDGVNIAARVESLTDSGGVCITGSAYEQVKNKIALQYEDMGAHAVKNIDDPVQIYRVRLEPVSGKVHAFRHKTAVKRKWQKETLAVLLAILVMAWALRAWEYYWKKYVVTPPANTIAVLPFDNMTGDPNQNHLADGLSENIITLLSQKSEMSVPARSSMFSFKGKPVDIKKAGRELRVRHILEGSIQRDGDRLRVTAQLIDAKTGNHLWSGRYDRKLGDILNMQDEISDKIITALQAKLIKAAN